MNDAGEAVDDVVGRHPRARLIDLPSNSHSAVARNAGIKASSGAYVAFLDDDDVYFPDHIETLVRAAQRSGASVVHGSTATVLLDAGEGNEVLVRALTAGVTQSLDHDAANVTCPFTGSLNLLVRREVFDDVGLFDVEMWPADDFEMLLRLMQKYDFVHADRATVMYSMRAGGSNYSVVNARRYVEAHRRIYRRHPRAERPGIEEMRRQFLVTLAGPTGLSYKLPAKTLAEPIPLSDLG
ncbi:MAG: glycosyltransferase [Candidatus Eremiobacteraeota bacterium]|nr:glycosyltransferase [Candidatus Eremiobacteraeota bacterium]